MAEVDYSKFSVEELEEEIRREEDALATYRADLAEAEARRNDLEAATSDERIAELTARVRLRQERIGRYERAIAELERQIQRYQQRIDSRQTQIRAIQESIAREEARLPRLTGMERFVTTETVARLDRSVAILQGWQTRDAGYLTLVRNTRTTNSRILAALRGWQVREATALERVEEMRAELTGVLVLISSLTALIRSESARLERKRIVLARRQLTITVNNSAWGTTTPAPGTYTYPRGTTATVTAKPREGYALEQWELDGVQVKPHPGDTINVLMDRDHLLNAVFVQVVKQLVHAKIIVYSVVRGPRPKPYTKRFQSFNNVTAVRDATTGEIDFDDPLTQKEIDACIDYFYALWNWTSLPARASEPVWIESGEWQEIDEPDVADLKEASVRENEEETYHRKFTPYEVIYVPSKSEKEAMIKRVFGKV